MAFTERYVTHDAGGGGIGTEGDPWTFAEALTSQASTDRSNVKAGAYSSGADAFTNAGTAVDLIVMRGYSTTIGDLENPGRSATTGRLVTTGFPVITLTGALTPNAHVVIQNLAITGALSSALISSTAIDNFRIYECEIINTQNNAAARAVLLDNSAHVIGSDLECTGAAHSNVYDSDTASTFMFNRVQSVAGNGASTLGGGTYVGNSFIGNGVGVAIQINSTTSSNQIRIVGNTIYNWATAFQTPNAAPVLNPMIINNHVTDCGEYINNLYSATDALPMFELNNRTRDNTTPRTGVGDGILSGEVTTDTGGIETDYVNAGADDLNLIAGAPGVDKGQGIGG